jgi:hypothetical protein
MVVKSTNTFPVCLPFYNGLALTSILFAYV